MQKLRQSFEHSMVTQWRWQVHHQARHGEGWRRYNHTYVEGVVGSMLDITLLKKKRRLQIFLWCFCEKHLFLQSKKKKLI